MHRSVTGGSVCLRVQACRVYHLVGGTQGWDQGTGKGRPLWERAGARQGVPERELYLAKPTA